MARMLVGSGLALLTGDDSARGRGTIGNDIRDPDGRVPYLWFQETDEHETPRQRFHLDVFVPREHAERRIAAALSVGGDVVSQTPELHGASPARIATRRAFSVAIGQRSRSARARLKRPNRPAVQLAPFLVCSHELF